ncbi:hypothetical protein LG003_20630 [Photorhabdus kleinii]|uniref:hypothetical protein n=1 Tax=Photorhabdus TaxID=29487 RepID=UPI0021D4CE47|nr:hypothetical protein [Photorhabdus kleinii]MCT8345183.1 hypothetical protein [Photorhabdus kleinii]
MENKPACNTEKQICCHNCHVDIELSDLIFQENITGDDEGYFHCPSCLVPLLTESDFSSGNNSHE